MSALKIPTKSNKRENKKKREKSKETLKDRNGEPEGGSEWEPIKILSQKNSAYIPIATSDRINLPPSGHPAQVTGSPGTAQKTTREIAPNFQSKDLPNHLES
jgi:hypothetical protein